MKKPLLLLIQCLFLSQLSTAQTFENGDLEGPPPQYFSQIPEGWLAIPFYDPTCLAEHEYGATPDMTCLTGPEDEYSTILGNPYSGQVFVTGLELSRANGGVMYHEGIMQNVIGFVPGNPYTISFFQTPIKQEGADVLDTAGCWAVYADNTLIGVSTPTVSLLPQYSTNLVWKQRAIVFYPTATSHYIKFLPWDDDDDYSCDEGPRAIRMGIDDIQLHKGFIVGLEDEDESELKVWPIPTKNVVTVRLKGTQAIEKTELTNSLGQLQAIICTPTMVEGEFTVDLSQFSTGIYFLSVFKTDGTQEVVRLQKD